MSGLSLKRQEGISFVPS